MHLYFPYLNWIATQEHILWQRVSQWVNINTFSSNCEGITRCMHILQQDFNSLGGEILLTQLPPSQKLMANGIFQLQPAGQVLSIRKRPHAPYQILLGGHLDTVYDPSSSFQTIEKQEQGICRGPGVTDMKGGLAILLTALEAVERSPFCTQLGWEVIINPDEEIGSPGSVPIFEAAASHYHVGLIFEPAFPDGAFVSERKGSVSYTVVVRGKEAHIGRDYEKGRSAVFAIARFISKLEHLQKQDKDLIINVADLEGRGPVNIVPPLASCRINIRSMQVQRLHQTSHLLKQWIQQNHQQDGIQIDILQDSFRPPKPFDSRVQKLFEAYEHCAQDLNIPFQIRETGGVCDGNSLAGAGLPTLDTAGAIGGALHTPQEYLILSSLVERAKLAALFLLKFANGEFNFNKGMIS